MKNKIVILACVASFLVIAQETKAAEGPALIEKILSVINNAKDGKMAQEELCKKDGVIRGSGISAGASCKGQDNGRIVALICKGYPDFEKSKCWANIKETIQPNQAVKFLSDAVVAGREHKNLASKLVCSPDPAWLPEGLKPIAEQCKADAAPSAGAGAAPQVAKEMPPFVKRMLAVINEAKDGKQAEEDLCKPNGLIRGSGLSSGENCNGQDIGRIVTVTCFGYPGFEKSKCWSNVKEKIQPEAAVQFLSNAIAAGLEQRNIASALVCAPARNKLPAGLKRLADQCDVAEALKERPVKVIFQSALRDLAKKDVVLKTEKILFYMEAAKAGMRNLAKKLSSAGKVGPSAGIKGMAPPSLIIKMDKKEEEANLALIKIKEEMETRANPQEHTYKMLWLINQELEDMEREFNQKYLEEQQINVQSEANFERETKQ